MNPDPLTVPEEVYTVPVEEYLDGRLGRPIPLVRAPWNREELPTTNASWPDNVDWDSIRQPTRISRSPSRRSLYLAIGSGFLLGLGVGIVVRRP